MKKVNLLLFVLHTFVGLGAISGGMMAILNPEGPGGMPADALQHSPFTNFLIPGIILFAVIGLGSLLSAVIIILKSKYQGYVSGVFSCALVIWILVQCIMLRTVVFLHVLFFIIGLVEVFFSIIILFEQRMFPTNVILGIVANLKKKLNNQKTSELQ